MCHVVFGGVLLWYPYVSCLGHLFFNIGFLVLKDCTSCFSWQAQSIQLSLQQRVGDSAEELSQLLQVRFR